MDNPTPPAPEAPGTPPPAPEPYAPPPPPPDYGAPPPPQPRRGRGPLVAIVLVVLLVILVGAGYVVGGFVYTNGKVNSATDAYNKVVDHENALTDLFNKLNSQFSKNSDPASATADTIKQEKTLYLQLASDSKAAQPTVESDDQALANAASSLNDNAWLTALSKSSLDKAASRLSHGRAALAVARTILADSILYGTFYASVDDAALDLDALDTAANAGDLNAVDSAIQTLKSDVGKAIQEDSAPGVAPQMDSFLKDLQKTANDFSALVAAVRAGNSAGVNAAVAALDADTTKLDGYDFTAMSNSEQAFYKALSDKYNNEVDAANKA